jgi:ferritin-like protein
MDLTNLQTVLEETFSANFVSYYRSHVAHVNIVGRNFASDHKLLQKVYEYFQGNIDILAEKLRTIRATMPMDLNTVCAISPIGDFPTVGDSIELFVHTDGCMPFSCTVCSIEDCKVRQQAMVSRPEWTLENILSNEKHRL